jgi:hypothetical protein
MFEDLILIFCRCVNHFIFSENDCFLANGTFYYPSQTKEECLKYTYCWTSESIVTGLLSPIDPITGNCPEGGTIQSLFEWKEAQWVGGTYAFTEWASRGLIAANDMRTTIDFPLLQNIVSYSSELSIQTSLQNQVD